MELKNDKRLHKTFNKNKKKYRVKSIHNNKRVLFSPEKVNLFQNFLKPEAFYNKFDLEPYKPYIIFRLYWFLERKIFKNKKLIRILTFILKYIIIPIVVVVISGYILYKITNN